MNMTRLYSPEGGISAPGGGQDGATGLLDETPPTTDSGGQPAADFDWKTTISEEYREAAFVKEASTLDELVKSALNAHAKVGADKVALPPKDATPEQMAEFHMALGRPEASSGYEAPTENLPDGFQFDEKGLEAAYQEFYEIGLNKQQAASLLRFDANREAARAEADAARIDKLTENTRTLLQSEYGKGYDDSIALANQMIREHGGEDLAQALAGTEMSANPHFIRMLVKLGKAIGEDEVIGRGRKSGFEKTPAEAKAAKAAKELDPEFMKAFTDNRHPGHKAAVDEMFQLTQLAHPEREG